MEIVLLAAGLGLYFLGFRNGRREARAQFANSVWMHHATDEERQSFLAGGAPSPLNSRSD